MSLMGSAIGTFVLPARMDDDGAERSPNSGRGLRDCAGEEDDQDLERECGG